MLGECLARRLVDAGRRGDPVSVEDLRQEGLDIADLAGAYAAQAAYCGVLGQPVRAWKVAKSPEGVPIAAPVFDLHGAGESIARGSGPACLSAIEVEICYPLATLPPVGPDASRRNVEAALGKPHLGIELLAFRLLERNKAPFPLFAADRLGNHSFLLGPAVPADIVSAMSRGDAGLPLRISCNGSVIYSAPAVHPAKDPMTPLLDYLADGARAGPLSASQIVTTGSLCGVVATDGPGAFEIELGPARVAFRLT